MWEIVQIAKLIQYMPLLGSELQYCWEISWYTTVWQLRGDLQVQLMYLSEEGATIYAYWVRDIIPTVPVTPTFANSYWAENAVHDE